MERILDSGEQDRHKASKTGTFVECAKRHDY